jgi:hypothetical protein
MPAWSSTIASTLMVFFAQAGAVELGDEVGDCLRAEALERDVTETR